MATFIERITPPVTGRRSHPPLRVAIKDLVDLVGFPTTAGSRAVAATAVQATTDAACLAGIRAAEAEGDVVIVGKTGLHELAFGVSGINPWYGTPTNPLDPARIPGGSSSGSAVAVATEEADVALGSDTGGSVRIPATCCGVAGLKTTLGRIDVAGVWPLAPSLDTVGPLARDVAGLRTGLALLDGARPGRPSAQAELGSESHRGPRIARQSESAAGGGAGVETIARFRLPANERIDAAIDSALRAAELGMSDVQLPGWAGADAAAMTILLAEAWATDGHLLEAGLGDDVATRIRSGAAITAAAVHSARRIQTAWQTELRQIIERFGPVALPVLAEDPPRLTDAAHTSAIRYTLPINLAGFPAVSIPVPTGGLPAGLQLVGLPNSEGELLDVAAGIEAAVGR